MSGTRENRRKYLKRIIAITFSVAVTALLIPRTETLRNATGEEVQNWYMSRVEDDLPLLDNIWDCDCPRIYIPVCGSDNKTYTNVCWMNCINVLRRKPPDDRVIVNHMGMCIQFLDPFDY